MPLIAEPKLVAEADGVLGGAITVLNNGMSRDPNVNELMEE